MLSRPVLLQFLQNLLVLLLGRLGIHLLPLFRLTLGVAAEDTAAAVKKSIYSLIDLREILLACNRRYLAHLSALDDFSAGVRAIDRLTKPRAVDGKTVKGIDKFSPTDKAMLEALQNPKVNIAGVRRADLLATLGRSSLLIACHATYAGSATLA